MLDCCKVYTRTGSLSALEIRWAAEGRENMISNAEVGIDYNLLEASQGRFFVGKGDSILARGEGQKGRGKCKSKMF